MAPLADIQGLILRGYGMESAAFFLLHVEEGGEARRILGNLPVASAAPWQQKPPFCINVGLTFEGLAALGVPSASLESFPQEFAAGAFRRCAEVGDTGSCSPETWRYGLGKPGLHALVLLFAQSAQIRDEQSAILREQLLAGGALSEIVMLPGDVLPGGQAHFGYRDGFSQPTIECGPDNPVPDRQPVAPTGEFLLGYPSQFDQFSYPVPVPDALGLNGSFMVLRILQQDCAAFDNLLRESGPRYGVDGELLAAKMVGRWRNGTPLTLSPDSDSPVPPVELSEMNGYDYAPTSANPDAFNDRRGFRCPIGSHMRRANPRGAAVAGNSGSRHRIVRRGVPYGPPFDPANPNDGIERGLLGLFIGVSIKDQFEFLMSEWMNGSAFAPGIYGTTDPILGNSPEVENKFVIPRENAPPVVISPFPQLVVTRGSAYTFLPSLTALRFLAGLPLPSSRPE
jgi:deferrochelatase/peroxidase EfeB